MTTCLLDSFRLDGVFYDHVIDKETDATHVISDYGMIEYTVANNGIAYRGMNIDPMEKIGRFLTEPGTHQWAFVTDDGSKILTSFHDLLEAERFIFKMLLSMKTK